jgi:hypothetical protein
MMVQFMSSFLNNVAILLRGPDAEQLVAEARSI